MLILTSWMLWEQRNAKAFNNTNQQRNVQQIVMQIKEELALWKLARVGGPRE
jgi:hypothetical protein